jgi:hypothetical protein|eukprot:SAG25_NODE_137_length_14197_cov_30.387120_14_plen_154_part_00
MPLKASLVAEDEEGGSGGSGTAWPSRKRAQAVKTLPAQAGIVVKTVQAWRGVDSIDKVFINCVSHEAVELPQHMGHAVDEDYYDHKGFEGLRVRRRPTAAVAGASAAVPACRHGLYVRHHVGYVPIYECVWRWVRSCLCWSGRNACGRTQQVW